MSVFHAIEGLIELSEVFRFRVAGAIACRVDERDIDLQGGVGKKAHELRLGLLFGGHQIENGDLNGTDIL